MVGAVAHCGCSGPLCSGDLRLGGIVSGEESAESETKESQGVA